MPEHHPERPRHYRGLGKILLGTSDFRGAAGAFACDLDFTACCSALDLNSLFWLGASLIGDLAFGHKQAGLDKLVKLSGHQLELVQDQVQQISAMRSVASDVKIGLSRSALSDDALEAISGTWQGEELVFNRKLELFREELPPELSLLLWGNRATDEITLFALIYLVALVFAADFQFRFHSVGQMEAALIGQIPVPLGRRLSEAEVARLNQWIFAGGVPGGQAGRLALRPDTACFEEVVPVQDLYWRIEASSGGLLRSRSRVYANVGPVNSIVEDTNVSDYELELVFPAETRSQGVPAGRSIEDGQLIQLITIPSVPILVIGSSLTSG
ncbi:MAG: hypothetical protein AMXMBFR19_01630 [Chthonomonadaceae bacterium]|uniref:Uncharacterized protein n=1 Tax=Candidatus Nitrosymbiomonas proteolyticus TaxID=2608984 RepID=A0A809S352_9BACT|nr:hypothetical protein NPRO_05210 [Candidatus Nitrosymbiomonas proteolyticus]